jgi:hypothetical protein
MYVHRERLTGQPLVLGIAAPSTRMAIVDASEHHITVALTDQRVLDQPRMPWLGGEDIPLQLVLSRELAAMLVDTIMRGLTGGEVDAVGALVHDLNCDCGHCPPRPEPGR